MYTTNAEIQSILHRCHPDKCPGSDNIPNRFLKKMGEQLAKLLVKLSNACLALAYFPVCFRQAQTIILQKPGKTDYSDPGAWRPIALLKTMGKVIESLLARKLSYLAETHMLLPGTQMGNRRQRSTETAVELLAEQIHTVWEEKNVASVLCLDVAGAFDTVNHVRLLENLRAKRLPRWLIQMIRSFLSNRTTTMVVDDIETRARVLHTGVPQGSPLSPILFLFYNDKT